MPSYQDISPTRLAVLCLIGLLAVAAQHPRAQAGPGPRAVVPRGEVPLDGKLKSWTYCQSGALVAAAVGEKVVVGRLDLSRKSLAPLATLDVSSWSLAFSGDCGLLALSEHSGDREHPVNGAALWRVTGKKITRVASLGTYRYPVSSLALSEDGRWAAVTTNVSELVVYRLDPQGKAKRTYEAPPLGGGDGYMRVGWSHGRLLGGTYKGHVRLFTLDPATGKLGAPRELLSPTVATREKGSLDLGSGEIVMPGGARVFAVDFSGDGKRAWAAVESGQVFAWDLSPAAGPGVKVVEGFDGPNEMALSPDGKQLAVTGNTAAQVWRLDGARATPLATLDKLDRVGKYIVTNGLRYVNNGQLLVGTGTMGPSRLLFFKP